MVQHDGYATTNTASEPKSDVRNTMRFSWWWRGGEPGPGYTSDKLDFEIQKNHADGTYIRARFDAAYEPPFLSEQFNAPLPEKLFRELLDSMNREKLFGSHFGSEDRFNVADAIKDTVSLTVGSASQEKTLYNSDASELRASKKARDAIAKYLVDHGNRTIRSRKKKT